MNIAYDEQEKLKTINDVVGANEKAFAIYMEAKEAYLQKRDTESIARIMKSAAWQMGRVA